MNLKPKQPATLALALRGAFFRAVLLTVCFSLPTLIVEFGAPLIPTLKF